MAACEPFRPSNPFNLEERIIAEYQIERIQAGNTHWPDFAN